MTDLMVIIILILIVFLASLYIYRVKKRGQKCIGCPYNRKCNSKCDGSCGCGGWKK